MRCHNPDDHDMNLHGRENLIWHYVCSLSKQFPDLKLRTNIDSKPHL
jgi:hypothetical protein